ncbi:hypothetical protein AB6Q85_002325 [Vibrio cholerae]
MLQLSLKLGIPIFELEEWDYNIIAEYKALNYLSPFTDEAQAYRDGLLLQFIYNQNISKKKDMRLATDLLPYLNQEPEWIEHEIVKKAKQFINLSKTPQMLADTLKKIQEQVDIELSKKEPDSYLITKLMQLIHKHNNK